MNKVYVTYEEYQTGGGIVEGDEYKAWPDYEDTYVTFRVLDVYTPQTYDGKVWYKEEMIVDFEPKIGQEVYVVLVRYSTVSTFGRTFYCGYIAGVYNTLEEAESVEDKIYKGTYPDYQPWSGYLDYITLPR
jgi:hypothetical protein